MKRLEQNQIDKHEIIKNLILAHNSYAFQKLSGRNQEEMFTAGRN